MDAAIAAMPWLTASDMALADLARTIAQEIEQATERAELLQRCYADAAGDPGMYQRLKRLEALCDVAKAVTAGAQPLLLALRDLGGTPASRKAMQPDKQIGGRLAQLRASSAGKRDAAAVDAAASSSDS